MLIPKDLQIWDGIEEVRCTHVKRMYENDKNNSYSELGISIFKFV